MMPEIHACAQLVVENEKLKKCVRQLRRDKDALLQQLQVMREREKVDSLLKQYVTTRNMEVQTDPVKTATHSRAAAITHQPKNQGKAQENDRINKLMILHNNLMKRYEKELKVNIEHVETINALNVKVHQAEQELKGSETKLSQLERRQRPHGSTRSCQHPRQPGQAAAQCTDDEGDICGLVQELRHIRKESDKLRKENKKLKTEFGGLDSDFFEEIEDMKFALQQSARLNQEYERSLKKLCTQFGVPYPNPASRLQSSRDNNR